MLISLKKRQLQGKASVTKRLLIEINVIKEHLKSGTFETKSGQGDIMRKSGTISGKTGRMETLPNPSSRSMTLGSIDPLTVMSIRNLPGDRGRPASKTDNLTAICERII
jgi:hypothetical protein